MDQEGATVDLHHTQPLGADSPPTADTMEQLMLDEGETTATSTREATKIEDVYFAQFWYRDFEEGFVASVFLHSSVKGMYVPNLKFVVQTTSNGTSDALTETEFTGIQVCYTDGLGTTHYSCRFPSMIDEIVTIAVPSKKTAKGVAGMISDILQLVRFARGHSEQERERFLQAFFTRMQDIPGPLYADTINNAFQYLGMSLTECIPEEFIVTDFNRVPRDYLGAVDNLICAAQIPLFK